MIGSLKSNYIYNVLNTISGLLFPLITFPYISRIIMADGIGQVQFYTSIINYVVLLTNLGIPLYGIREIARVRDNKRELSKTTLEIVTLNLLFDLIGYFIIFILAFNVSQIEVNIPLFLLLSTSIILTTIGCPWFYSGIEEFKYITIRGIVVKVLCIGFLFLTVHCKEDLMWYGCYSVLGTLGNNILNFIRLKKYIRIRTFHFVDLNIVRHIKPAFQVFILNVITSIYVNLDAVMLGFLQDTASVGYYTASTRLSHLLLGIVTSLGAVLLPRLTNLIKNEQYDVFKSLAEKSYNYILFISCPLCCGLIVLSPSLIHVFCGDAFDPAILTLQILSPIIVAIAVSNLIGIQILYPQGLVKPVILSTCVGASLNCILNFLLIPSFSQNGAAIATIVAEVSVPITQFIIAKSFIPFHLINLHFVKYLVASLIMMAGCFSITVFNFSSIINIILIPFIGTILYFSFMAIFKDDIFMNIYRTLIRKYEK